jgi:hypothetical protein
MFQVPLVHRNIKYNFTSYIASTVRSESVEVSKTRDFYLLRFSYGLRSTNHKKRKMALFTLDQHVAPYYRLVAFISVQTNGDTTRVTKKRCVFGISDKWGNLEGKRLLGRPRQ